MTPILLLVLAVPRPLAPMRPTLPRPMEKLGAPTPEGLGWWMRHPNPRSNMFSPPPPYPFDIPEAWLMTPDPSPLRATAETLRRVLEAASAEDPCYRISTTSAIQLATSIAVDLVDLIEEHERVVEGLRAGLAQLRATSAAALAEAARTRPTAGYAEGRATLFDIGRDVAYRWEC